MRGKQSESHHRIPGFLEVSRHLLCNNYSVVCLEILSTGPALPNSSSHNHVCSFYCELYKPNHDLRELNILLGKPPHPQSGSLGCQLHCNCMCSFYVSKRDQDSQRDVACGFSNMWLFHEHAPPVSANSCICSQHMFVLVMFIPNIYYYAQKSGMRSCRSPAFNKAEAELKVHCNESPGNCFESVTL